MINNTVIVTSKDGSINGTLSVKLTNAHFNAGGRTKSIICSNKYQLLFMKLKINHLTNIIE